LVIAAGLVAPLGHVAGRHADLVRAGFAVAGIVLAVLSLVALFISESSSLFNFTENGYRTAIVLAIIAEAAATVFLVSFLALSGRPAWRGRSLS
jgi:branched-subunit amino acid permease